MTPSEQIYAAAIKALEKEEKALEIRSRDNATPKMKETLPAVRAEVKRLRQIVAGLSRWMQK